MSKINELILVLRVAYARAYVRIKGVNRDLTHFFIDVFLPLLGISAIILAYKSMGAPENLLGFAAIGGAMIAFWYNVLWSMGSQLYWDKEQGNLQLYIISPAPLIGILLGMAIGGAFNMSLRAITILIATSLLFNIKFNLNAILPAFLIFILTLFALYSLGMIFASTFLRFGRSISKINELLGEPILFFSGVYFPLKLFPIVIQIVVSIIPLALGIEGMREILILNKTLFEIIWILILLIALGIIFFVIAVKMLEYLEKLGKNQGTLTLKWD
jgi:ABC-type polysaccharide/polyol phosphate export systems, permease component